MLNIVFLNPPNKNRIQRRYMCSYNAPNMLLPPQELIALAGMCRDKETYNTLLLDTIADNNSLSATIQKITDFKTDVVIAIQGFECFDEDMEVFCEIKKQIPHLKLVLFGHYATLFPEEILQHVPVDIIILGEPDNIFSDLITALSQSLPLHQVNGIAYRNGTDVVVQHGEDRIRHPDQLPMPAYELLHTDRYYEPLLKPPLGLIQSARGCPYTCNFCIRSYGKKLTYRTTDQIVEEIVFLKNRFGIRSLRFIDDTFTVHTKRVIEICQKLIDLNLDIEWACLSRLDTLKREMIPWMKKSGCKRIYFGVESGSSDILTYINKGVNLEECLPAIRACKSAGIETVGFFMIGTPVETRKDFEASVGFAILADFDFITVNTLIAYPGTVLFDNLKDQINFSLFPYQNEWKDKVLRERNKKWEKEFYKRFYFRSKFFLQNTKRVIKEPMNYFDNFRKLLGYLISGNVQERSNYL